MEKWIKSRYLQQIPNGRERKVFIYHTLFGNPRIFNKEGLNFLTLFEKGKTIKEIQGLIKGNPIKLIADLSEINFLIPVDFDERKILSQRRAEHLKRLKNKKTIDHISLSVSNICNFGCTHCMFFQYTNEPSKFYVPSKMEWEMARKCIDSYIKILKETESKHGRIHFGNAEPLLNWSVIKRVLEYCESFSDFSFEYGINTNLSMLTHEMAETMKRYKMRIATSLDGIGKVNDLIRFTKSGKGTFQKLVGKFELLEKIGYPLDSISITVTSKNFQSVNEETIDFAVSKNMKSIAFDYDLIHLLEVPIDKRVDKVIKLKYYADHCGIFFGGTWGAPFRKLMSISLLNQPYAFCATAEGVGLTFDPDGVIKVCDYSIANLGHVNRINELFQESGGLYRFVENQFPGFDSYCEGCVIEGFCAGQCYVTREVDNRTSNGIFKDMCNFYKAMTYRLIQENLSS